ncbi:MAG TPA: MoaD/ThiS family protein, partial [Gammaproteobacteria bacterium]|nr:MoaD/ThiS family protein [Gammaproteobacteria bacterium]
MISVTVRIPTPLRPYAGGDAELVVAGATVGDALKTLSATHEGLGQRLFTPEGQVRRYVNVFVGSDDINGREGLATPLRDGDVIAIIPSVAGGSPRARDARLAALREQIPEVEPRRAHELQSEGAILVDVREQEEIAAGSPI